MDARAALAAGQWVLTDSRSLFAALDAAPQRFELALRRSGNGGFGAITAPSLLVLNRAA